MEEGKGSALFRKAMARESTVKKKKISRVSPCFLHLKIFKTALMGDIRQCSSRHRHRCRRYRRRYRRSVSKVEKQRMMTLMTNC
jgi:hypothetical protein